MRLNYVLTLIAILLAGGIWYISQYSSSEKPNDIASQFENHEEDEAQKRFNAEERWKHEFNMVKDPKTGKIPQGIRQKELKVALKVPQFQLARSENASNKALPTITITERGPNNYGGRTRALGFDVRNANIVIAGGVTSGIYRSTDGGVTWTRVTPAGVIHSLTCLAQDPRVGHQDTWYAGTGEISSSAGGSGASYLGFGIYKSTDNGLTWSALANTQLGSLESFDNGFDGVHRIVVDPTNGNVLATALNSIRRSTDGGANWTNVLGVASGTFRSDLIYNTVSGKFYAAIDEGFGATINPGIWSSTTGASGTWTQERTPAQLSATIFTGRIVLANVANTDDIVAFFEFKGNFTCTNGNTTKAGLLHFDGTSTWTSHTDEVGDCTDEYTASSALPTQLELQGGYNMALATKPNDANIVYLAGTEGYRYNLSTNAYEFIGGSQLEANTVNLHVDQHIFMFEPGSNDIMWAGNDGGLRRTDVTGAITATTGNHDNGYTWSSRSNGYNGYQFYGIDIDPANASNFIAGAAQDNAHTIHPVNATADEVGPTADGVDVAVISGSNNFTNHHLLLMIQFGSLFRLQNDVLVTGAINPANTGFVGTFYLDADNTDYMYFPSSSSQLFRTRIASTIGSSTITGNAATGWETLTGVGTAIGAGDVSSFDASRDIQYGGSYTVSDANRKLYLGTDDGKVYRLNDPAFVSAATAPVNITPPGSGGFVSDIAVNPLDDREILVTYSNYGTPSVWHTSDASVATPTWTNVEGAAGSAVELASARSAMITKDGANTIYMVGTSTGLYATDALSGATTSWTRLGTSSDIGLAVSVEMRLRPSDNTIVLGTHGNGAFTLDFPTPLPVEFASFEGQAIQDGNQLDWRTSSEFNNDGFEIQKSEDGESFKKIGFVKGHGTTYEQHSYTYLDKELTSNTAYYRLKQIDNNNEYSYSEVISISNTAYIAPQVKIYPNPATDYLIVEHGEGIATIYNASGQLVKSFRITGDRQRMNVSSLPKGNYAIRFTKEDGQAYTRQFVK